METRTITLDVTGMSCNGCVQAVTKALRKNPAVKRTTVVVGRAEVEFDPAAATVDGLIETVEKAGYTAKVHASAGGSA